METDNADSVDERTTPTSDLTKIVLDQLDTVEMTQADSDTEFGVSIPFAPDFPANTGLELAGGHTVVYTEIPPGKELGTHTDSPEELLVCLEGDGVEVWVGDGAGELAAGEMAVFPAMAPHGLRNTGSKTARFVAFFSDSTTVHEFEAPLDPLGHRTVRT